MTSDGDRLARIRAAIDSEPRIRPIGGPIRLAFLGRDLLLEGEVDHVAGKKLALRTAARASGAEFVDRLHVRPAVPMGDGEIRAQLRDALLGEPVLADCAIHAWQGGRLETICEPDRATGRIAFGVQDAVLTLDGEVAGLDRERFAGVVRLLGSVPSEQERWLAEVDAWHVFGVDGVLNRLDAQP